MIFSRLRQWACKRSPFGAAGQAALPQWALNRWFTADLQAHC
jgi:hypothetical protein